MLDLPFSITFEGKDYPLHDYYHDGKVESVRFARLDETYALVFEILLLKQDEKYTLEIIGDGRRLKKRNLSLKRIVDTNWTFDE